MPPALLRAATTACLRAVIEPGLLAGLDDAIAWRAGVIVLFRALIGELATRRERMEALDERGLFCTAWAERYLDTRPAGRFEAGAGGQAERGRAEALGYVACTEWARPSTKGARLRECIGWLVERAEDDSPHALLTAVYEDVLRLRPDRSAPGGRLRLVRADAVRKADGQFYTPAPIARLVVQHTLAPLRRRGWPLRILDPTMGTGVFLVEAARCLATGESPVEIAEQCLHGVDRDPLAVELAIYGLWLETGAAPAALAEHLSCADLLFAAPPTQAPFDAVMGNPPWGSCFTTESRSLLVRRFPALAEGTFDSFKLFLDLGASLTGGTLGMIVPQAVLSQTTHADIRRRLLSAMAPRAVVRLGDRDFRGAATPACALIFGPRSEPADIVLTEVNRRTGGHPLVARAIGPERWTEQSFTLSDDGSLDLLHQLRRRHPVLGDLTRLYRVRDAGINYNRASVARRSLYVADEPDDSRDLPRYRGRDFDRYTTVRRSGWLRHDVEERLLAGERFSLSRAVIIPTEKIVLRQTADRLVATLDGSGMAMGRSVIAITGERWALLAALLACLNSRLLTTLYRAIAGEEGRIMPQVKVSRLHALPIPAVGGQWGGCWHPDWRLLDDLGRQMLACGGRDRALDETIDRVVERLYDIDEFDRVS